MIILLHVEHQKEVEIEEEKSILEPKCPPVGYKANCNILVEELESPPHQGKLRYIHLFPCCLQNFDALYDALCDRSCMMNN